MDYILQDASRLVEMIVQYFSALDQTALFVHFAVILIGGIIAYMIAYRFHVRVMLNAGVTWVWLLRGVYVVLLIGGVTGVGYQWARFEAQITPDGMTTFLIFVLAPVAISLFLLSAAAHAMRTTKIERNVRRGQKDVAI